MKLKLCLVNPCAVPEEFQDATFAMYKASFNKVLHPDTQVVFKPPRGALPGDPDHASDFVHPYFSFLNRGAIVEAIIEAEKDGCDAAWVNCVLDPGVAEARAAVDMPVVGLGESTMHFACQLGRKFALVMPTGLPGLPALAEEAIRRQGLWDRLSINGLRWTRHSIGEFSVKGAQNPQFVADDVAQTARQCAADGADVVIVFCGGTGPLCSMVGLNRVTVAGHDVPVLDPHMIAAKTAEMCAAIKKGAGLPIPSRANDQYLPTREDMARVRSVFGLRA